MMIKMNKLTKYMLGVLGSIILCKTASAQDFYNGCRGPKAFQIDNYINHSNEKTSGMIIPKMFTKNLDSSLTDMVIAIPNGISEKGIDNKGINTGIIFDNGNASYITALGLFKDDKGKYVVLNPQAYATLMKDPWTFDAEGNLPINLRTHETGEFIAATIGYAISDDLRIGGSIIKEKNKDIDFKANIRIRLEENNKYWAQIYAGKNYLGARLVANF